MGRRVVIGDAHNLDRASARTEHDSDSPGNSEEDGDGPFAGVTDSTPLPALTAGCPAASTRRPRMPSIPQWTPMRGRSLNDALGRYADICGAPSSRSAQPHALCSQPLHGPSPHIIAHSPQTPYFFFSLDHNPEEGVERRYIKHELIKAVE